ncbi:MAG: transketolase-like TK C-terminal-containing protein, partial [Microbacterium sp.]|uniref:transketolase-like TK C-terminal-containing protein n=2 Tax=Microbacteriaceae TaxID=85023 RepID=UPI003D6BECBA
LATLRAIPNFTLVRPADANETATAWLELLTRHTGPAGIALSRQNLPVFTRGEGDATATELASAAGVVKGAYILADTDDTPDVILIATGSEVQLALAARDQLATDGIAARVVSAPSLEWFAEQDDTYREHVLPAAVTARVSVEAGSALSWHAIVGTTGRTVAIDHFGASADYKTLYAKFGFTAEAVVEAARQTIQENNA